VGTYEELIPTADLLYVTQTTNSILRNGDYAIDEKVQQLIPWFHLWKKECKFVKTSPLLCVLQNVLDQKFVRNTKRFGVPTLLFT
jgi:hypothetical protein